MFTPRVPTLVRLGLRPHTLYPFNIAQFTIIMKSWLTKRALKSPSDLKEYPWKPTKTFQYKGLYLLILRRKNKLLGLTRKYKYRKLKSKLRNYDLRDEFFNTFIVKICREIGT